MDRNFGEDSLVLQNSKILSAEERKSIHEGNINILNSKTEDQILKDKVKVVLAYQRNAYSYTIHVIIYRPDRAFGEKDFVTLWSTTYVLFN